MLMATLASGVLHAADAPPEKLSLTDAVSMALGENPNLKQSEESYLSARSELRIANVEATYGVGSETQMEESPNTSGLSGRVFGSLNYFNRLGTEASLDVSPFGMGSQRGSIGLSIRHPLAGGRGRLSDKANLVLGAQSASAVQSRQFYQSRQATVSAVIDAYYQAVLATERIKVQEKAVKIAEEALDGAKKRLDARLVTGLEVSRAETNLAQTKDALNLQHQTARGAVDRLMIAVGVGVGRTLELTDGIPESGLNVVDLGTAIDTALQNRSELAVYDWRLSDQERRLAVAEDQMRPRVDAVIGYRSQNESTGAISTSLFNSGSLTAGFEVNLPLDRVTRVEERDTTARGIEVLKELRAYRADQIIEEVRRAYRSLDATQTSLSIYSQNLQAANEQLYLAQRMVLEGLGSNREVQDAQNSLTRVESGLLAAKTDLYLAGVELMYAMGEDLSTVVLK